MDMTESELAEFKRAGQENYRILAELLNGTERWDELRTLEVRFRESGDTGMVTSITYEGETLKRKMQDLYRDYLEQDDVILSTGERFEIDTAGYEASTVDFREIVNGISSEMEGGGEEIAGLDESTISLEVSPGRVSYGDTVRMEGRVEDAADGSPGEVVLFIDSAKKVTLRSGQDGYFSYGHLVERDRAGTHTVFAVRDGSLFSTLESFTVDAVPSELLLGPPRVLDGKVLCQGTLSAGTRPVRAAPVEIAADGKRLATVQTGDDGTFTAEVRMAPGAYRLRAEFQGEGFPLLRSESEPYEVVVPVPPPASGEEEGFTVDPLSLLVVCGFLCLSGAGAFYYLRHRKHRIRLPRAATPVPESPPGETPVSAGEQAPAPQVPAELAPGPGLPPTATDGLEGPWPHLFRRLRSAVSKAASLRYPHSLTPRELCALCGDARIREFVCRFASGYEKVVYAGMRLRREEEECMVQAYRTVLGVLEGEDH